MDTTIVILIVAVLVIGVVIVALHDKWKAEEHRFKMLLKEEEYRMKERLAGAGVQDESKAERTRPASEIVEEILKGLNCEYRKSDYQDWADSYEFRYQNGFFIVTANRIGLDFRIFFPSILFVETDQREMLAEVCNNFNYGNIVCKVYTTYNEQMNSLDVHLILDGNFGSSCVSCAKAMQSLLDSAFSGHRQFVDIYERKKKELPGTSDLKEEIRREDFLLAQHENPQHGKRNADSPAEPMSLLNLWSLTCERWLLKDPERLTIVGEGIDVITDLAAIQRQDVVRPLIELRSRTEGEKPSEMTYLLKYRDENVAITVELLEENDKEATLSLSIASDWVDLTTDGSQGKTEHPIRININYDKRTQEEQYAEYRFMASEADETDTPTPAQEELRGQTDKPWAEALYWGTKAFMERRTVMAIHHLEEVYESMKNTYRYMSDREKEEFFRVIFRLGFCYNELGLYKQAYFYLDGVFRTGSLNNNEEFINTLVNSEDWRTEPILDAEWEHWFRWCTENPEHQAQGSVMEYLRFLGRKKTLYLIGQKRLKEAKNQLESMLEDEPSADFAREQLDYIKFLEKDENRSGDNRQDNNGLS